MGLSSKIRFHLEATQTGPNDFGGLFTPLLSHLVTLGDGTTATNADVLFTDERTVATASNDDIDLNGLLTNAFGQTVSMVEIVAILIINAPRSGVANTTNLTVGGGTNPVVGWLGGTTPTLGPIRPGGAFMRAESDGAGMCVVTPGTGDILRVANSAGASATYQIAVIGRSA